MSFQPQHAAFGLSPTELTDAVLNFTSHELFLDNEEWVNGDNPYRRQLRPQVVPHLDFGRQLGRDSILEYSALAANRILATIYELDSVLLPKADFPSKAADFRAFYSDTNRANGEMIRPSLENHVFGFLDDEVVVSGDWRRSTAEEFFRDPSIMGANVASFSEEAIRNSPNAQRSAQNWLIQFAPDFLSEASPMIRNVMGYYGDIQSEWFKVIIDEYGYGVHPTKHSTLFESTLTTCGLQADAHRYWQFYLTSSLMASNYFHYIGKNHEHFFRYLGALFYTETTLIEFCRRAAALLTETFGEEADVRYFTEHVHIDRHHSRMALDKMILPAIDQFGEGIIPDIVRGFEEFKLLADIADRDFADQVRWMDAGPANKEVHDPVWARVERGEVVAPVAHLDEPFGELSNTHQHDGDELCHIVEGTMRFVSGYDSSQILHGGQGTVIWKNRLHGAIIESDRCLYEIHSVGDYASCLP